MDDFDRQTCYKNSYKMGCTTKIPEMIQELNAIIYNKYSERKVLLTVTIVTGIIEVKISFPFKIFHTIIY